MGIDRRDPSLKRVDVPTISTHDCHLCRASSCGICCAHPRARHFEGGPSAYATAACRLVSRATVHKFAKTLVQSCSLLSDRWLCVVSGCSCLVGCFSHKQFSRVLPTNHSRHASARKRPKVCVVSPTSASSWIILSYRVRQAD